MQTGTHHKIFNNWITKRAGFQGFSCPWQRIQMIHVQKRPFFLLTCSFKMKASFSFFIRKSNLIRLRVTKWRDWWYPCIPQVFWSRKKVCLLHQWLKSTINLDYITYSCLFSFIFALDNSIRKLISMQRNPKRREAQKWNQFLFWVLLPLTNNRWGFVWQRERFSLDPASWSNPRKTHR